MLKRTFGIHGRKDPGNGPTDFKSWDAFEEEVSFIWRNCREYNEDGSDMYELAGEFEVCCLLAMIVLHQPDLLAGGI